MSWFLYPLSLPQHKAESSSSGVFFSDDETDGVDASAGAVQHVAQRKNSEVRVPLARMMIPKNLLKSTPKPSEEPVRPAQPTSVASHSSRISLPSLSPSSLASVSGVHDFTDGGYDDGDLSVMPESPLPSLHPAFSQPVPVARKGDMKKPSLLSGFGRSIISVVVVAYVIGIFFYAFSLPSSGQRLFYSYSWGPLHFTFHLTLRVSCQLLLIKHSASSLCRLLNTQQAEVALVLANPFACLALKCS